MADIELVIKIDEGIAQDIIDGEKDVPRTIVRSFQSTIAYAIKYGTPLPKGHGRLKDIDKIETLLDLDKADNEIAKALKNIMERVPTIIEADKGESEE